jgi:hypothetical protein
MKIFTKRTKLVKKAGFKRKMHIIIEIPFRTEWDFFLCDKLSFSYIIKTFRGYWRFFNQIILHSVKKYKWSY